MSRRSSTSPPPRSTRSVRKGDLEAVKIGGRGQWRVEASKLEEYIAQLYKDTREFVETHPLTREEEISPELD